MRWDWETFPEYLDSLEHQGLGLNIGSLFPFSPMRGYVLGMMEARERTSVTDAELNQMKQLFHEAMIAGAFGFSFNKNLEDRPEDGSLLPSHVASDEEYMALSEVLAQFGVGHVGLTHGFGLTPDQRSEVRDLVTLVMKVSGRPFNLLDVELAEATRWLDACRADELPLLIQRGSATQGDQFTLSEFNLYDYMPHWVQPLVGTPAERAAKLRVADREAMKRDVEEWPNVRTDWSRIRVVSVVRERNYRYEGMTIPELAEATGKHPVDAFIDLALDEDLETEFWIPPLDSEEELKAQEPQLTDSHSHISVSDGGAHTKFHTLSLWPGGLPDQLDS